MEDLAWRKHDDANDAAEVRRIAAAGGGAGGATAAGAGGAGALPEGSAAAANGGGGAGGGSGDPSAGGASLALPSTVVAPGGGAGGASGGPVSMTPQVQVINGQIVINEQSLTVNAAVERATALSDFTRVEENGTKLNSATYANYTKAEKWTREDTEFFFQALRQFGTDFSLIQRLFPSRSRRQIKKKYLVEDKMNPGRVEAAIKNLNPDTALYQNLIDVLQMPESAAAPAEGITRTVLENNANAAAGALGDGAAGEEEEEEEEAAEAEAAGGAGLAVAVVAGEFDAAASHVEAGKKKSRRGAVRVVGE